VTSYELGENLGRGNDLESNFDDIPVSSVVYMGRGSFRMEVTPEPVRTGIVQPITAVVTAPLHAKAREDSDGNARVGAKRPRSLFGSQVDVPVLAAPMGLPGLPGFPAPAGVSLSRATLATLGGAVLLCGIIVGTAARHLWSQPAPIAVVATTPVAAVAPAPVAAPSVPAVAPIVEPQLPVVAVPAPVTIRSRARTAVKPIVAPARKPEEPSPAPKQWVDPWAS